jgi:NDP-sugar pyrophosphorylase family protein
MPIETAFIFAAGFGRRMGVLGEFLPKPLWPLGKSTLISEQIDFLQNELGIKKIYVNTHHRSELMREYFAQVHPEVTLVEEKEIQGSGGGFHHFCSKFPNQKDPLLLVNSDVLIKFSSDFFAKIANDFCEKSHYMSLLLADVPGKSRYGKVVTNPRNKIIEVDRSYQCIDVFQTYSGYGLIDPKQVLKVKGPSEFFDSLANYSEREIFSYKINHELKDYGELELYWKNAKGG